MNTSQPKRRAWLAALIAGSVIGGTAGCSGSGMSLAALNPMSKPASPNAGALSQPAPSPNQTLAANQTLGGNQNASPASSLASFGTKTKNAVVKTTGSVTRLFSRDKSADGDDIPDDDPLRLDHRPGKVNPEVFVANGQLWESTGNFAKAMESYSKALERETNHTPALTNIARLHFRQGNHRQAAAFFKKAIAQAPDDSELHHDMGLALSRLGRRDEAIERISHALSLSPDNSQYANHLATVQFESGDQEAAFASLKANSNPAVAHFNMAYLYFKNGHTGKARDHLNETLQFEPLAASDTAVKRAVDRSRQMLKQMNGDTPEHPVAKPETSIATRPDTNGPNAASTPSTSPSRQTSSGQTSSGQTSSGQTSSGQTSSGQTSSVRTTPNQTTPPAKVFEPGTGTSYSLPSGFTMPTSP